MVGTGFHRNISHIPLALRSEQTRPEMGDKAPKDKDKQKKISTTKKAEKSKPAPAAAKAAPPAGKSPKK